MAGVKRVLFVCAGNICRSPMAEGLLRRLLRERGLEGAVEVDSAGTGGWHAGERADPRTERALERAGASFAHAARQVRPSDAGADLLLVMDRRNLRDLEGLLPGARGRARLVMDFAPGRAGEEVPDPFYGPPGDFERVRAMLEAAMPGVLEAALAP